MTREEFRSLKKLLAEMRGYKVKTGLGGIRLHPAHIASNLAYLEARAREDNERYGGVQPGEISAE